MLKELLQEKWDELSYYDKLVLRNVGILMLFNLAGCYGIFLLCGMSLYTLCGCIFVIAGCSIAGNIINKNIPDEDE